MFDNSKFERIINQYYKPLYQYCYYRLSSDRSLTEETVNDVFRILYEKWDRIDTEGNIRAYLYRVADIRIKMAREKYRRYYDRVDSLDALTESGVYTGEVQYDEYFQDEYSYEQCIEKITAALTEEYKQIFLYRFVEKKTINEISRLTGIPYSSVRLRIAKIETAVYNEVRKIFD